VDGFHIFAIDISDRKRTEQVLAERVAERTAALEAEMANREQMEAALRQSQKMEAVGQLTGGIAHDFNNMLTGIIGAMDIMKRRIAAERYDDLDRFMDAAAASAQRAASLTARLLAFSRRQSLDPQPVDTNTLVRSLDDLLRRTIGENIHLEIVEAADLPPATVDANQLESAILNLSINARDAMPNGGTLTIETRLTTIDADIAARQDVAPGRYVIIAVTDTGVGMTPDVLEKVFDPFFTTKPIGQGTGLGLSMVYGFARQSSGQVRVHSQPGVGTTVSIHLPVADAAMEAEPTAPVTSSPEGAWQNVLLVEDDPSVRLLVREVLKELSYAAVEAGRPEEAIAILESGAPIDLMISDVGLPGMNGRQLADIARQHRPDLPILFITGYAENAAIRAGFLGTRMAMITKPFALDTLAGKIAEMIGGSLHQTAD
jgi:signal transduction histidine kinase/ActR/RegA family two-component response regulator